VLRCATNLPDAPRRQRPDNVGSASESLFEYYGILPCIRGHFGNTGMAYKFSAPSAAALARLSEVNWALLALGPETRISCACPGSNCSGSTELYFERNVPGTNPQSGKVDFPPDVPAQSQTLGTLDTVRLGRHVAERCVAALLRSGGGGRRAAAGGAFRVRASGWVGPGFQRQSAAHGLPWHERIGSGTVRVGGGSRRQSSAIPAGRFRSIPCTSFGPGTFAPCGISSCAAASRGLSAQPTTPDLIFFAVSHAGASRACALQLFAAGLAGPCDASWDAWQKLNRRSIEQTKSIWRTT
jgi:hypothetical protein